MTATPVISSTGPSHPCSTAGACVKDALVEHFPSGLNLRRAGCAKSFGRRVAFLALAGVPRGVNQPESAWTAVS